MSREEGSVAVEQETCVGVKGLVLGALQKYGSVGATRGLPAVIAVFLAVRVGRRAGDF